MRIIFRALNKSCKEMSQSIHENCAISPSFRAGLIVQFSPDPARAAEVIKDLFSFFFWEILNFHYDCLFVSVLN